MRAGCGKSARPVRRAGGGNRVWPQGLRPRPKGRVGNIHPGSVATAPPLDSTELEVTVVEALDKVVPVVHEVTDRLAVRTLREEGRIVDFLDEGRLQLLRRRSVDSLSDPQPLGCVVTPLPHERFQVIEPPQDPQDSRNTDRFCGLSLDELPPSMSQAAHAGPATPFHEESVVPRIFIDLDLAREPFQEFERSLLRAALSVLVDHLDRG